MADLAGFDASTVVPSAAFTPIPAGDYKMQIIASAMEPTSNGQGRFLKLELEITEGEHAGRKTFDRLNLENHNQQAVDISKRTLSAICHAVGNLQPRDSVELHFKVMEVKIAVVPRKDRPGEFSNEIKGYKAVGGAAGGGQQQGGSTQQNTGTKSGFTPGNAAGGAGGGAPWKRS